MYKVIHKVCGAKEYALAITNFRTDRIMQIEMCHSIADEFGKLYV
jgi:hypothetical protein